MHLCKLTLKLALFLTVIILFLIIVIFMHRHIHVREGFDDILDMQFKLPLESHESLTYVLDNQYTYIDEREAINNTILTVPKVIKEAVISEEEKEKRDDNENDKQVGCGSKPSYSRVWEEIHGKAPSEKDFLQRLRREENLCRRHFAYHVDVTEDEFQEKYLNHIIAPFQIDKSLFNVKVRESVLNSGYILNNIKRKFMEQTGLAADGYKGYNVYVNTDVLRNKLNYYLDLNMIVHKEGKSVGKAVAFECSFNWLTKQTAFARASVIGDVPEDWIMLAATLTDSASYKNQLLS